MTTGALIRAARLARQMKIADLARASGVSPAAISRWEREERAPGTPALAQVARALAVDPGTLMDVPNGTLGAVLPRLSATPGDDSYVLEAIQVVARLMPGLPEAGRTRVLRIIKAALDTV